MKNKGNWDKRYESTYKLHSITNSKEKVKERLEFTDKCEICKKKWSEKTKPCLDHNHKTGQIRGLLCSQCNSILGFSKESISILLSSIEYIKKYNTNDRKIISLYKLTKNGDIK